MKLDLDIDRLAIPGIDPFTRHRLTAALERELDRLAVSHGLPKDWQAGTVDVGAASIHVAPDSSAAEIGVQVARQVFSGLQREATGRAPADTGEETP